MLKTELLNACRTPLGALKILESSELEITPALANEILDTMSYEGQRAISKADIAKYANDMKQGRFRCYEPITIAVRSWDGKEVLINGYHRLKAVISSGVAVVFIIQFLQVDGEQELDSVYLHFDRGRKRNHSQMISLTLKRCELGFSEQQLRDLTAAVRVLLSDFYDPSQPTTKAMVEKQFQLNDLEWLNNQVLSWTAEGKKYFDLTHGCTVTRRKLTSRASMAVALVTLRDCPELATWWWKTVAENDGLKRGTPAHTLLNSVLETDRAHLRLVNVITRRTAACWNTVWRSNRENWQLRLDRIANREDPDWNHGELTIAKVYEEHKYAPIKILGTTYRG